MNKPQPKIIEIKKAKQEISDKFTKELNEQKKSWKHRLWSGRIG